MEKYLDILKRAWTITWRYKALWVLGLFAGTASGGSGGSSGGSGDFSGGTGSGNASDPFSDLSGSGVEQWFEQNLIAVIIIAAVLVLIGLVFWVLSVAAQGGLIKGVNEAAEGRTPTLGAAWSFGFGKWGRTFMTGFVLGLPVLLVVLVMVGVLVSAGIGGALTGEAGAAVAVGGVCVVLPIMVLLIIAGSLLIGVLYPVALRYGMLHDVTFGQSIKRAWSDVWGKRGVWVFWLVMLLPGIVFGFVTFLVMLPFLLPGVFLFIGGKYIIGGALMVLMILVLMVPSAIYATFVSAAWTIFFRRMTGMEPEYQAVSAPAAAPAVGYAPPATPTPTEAPQTPEPPAPPAPPAAVTTPPPTMPVAAPAPPASAIPEAPPVPPAPPAPPASDA